MSTPLHDEIQYGTLTIPFTTVFADRKTLEIGVEPDGAVLVKAPAGTPYVTVRKRVADRARWIERQRKFFASLTRPVPRRYVSGETHRYLGRQYRLRVERAQRPEVKLTGPYLIARTPDGSPTSTARVLNRWYRQRAAIKLAERLSICKARMGYLGIPFPELQLRQMVTRWGSWTPSGKIILNPDLIRTPILCIDYVVTHELCHALHPYHSPAFYQLLTSVMPDWRMRRTKLNGMNW